MQNFFAIYIENPWLLTLSVAVVSLCIGSFLNVVIYRLPLQMQREWEQQCYVILKMDEPEHSPYTLSKPASTCRHCGHLIRWYENIPLISWLFLRGKCSSCKNPISIRYPLVELSTMLASLVVLYVFGPTLQMLCGLLFTWMLIALSGIDFDTQYLPDSLTMPLIGIGLLINVQHTFTTPESAILGSIIAFSVLWFINFMFEVVAKKTGMGAGDFKLFAAFGAWMGYQHLLPILLVSSVIGSLIGIVLLIIYRKSKYFPFGPCLAFAAWIQLLWGDQIVDWYMGTTGMM